MLNQLTTVRKKECLPKLLLKPLIIRNSKNFCKTLPILFPVSGPAPEKLLPPCIRCAHLPGPDIPAITLLKEFIRTARTTLYRQSRCAKYQAGAASAPFTDRTKKPGI